MLTINRPVNAPQLYRCIFDLMRELPLVLFIPGECPALIGRAEYEANVPVDATETQGAAVVLQSADDILGWIARA